MGFGMPLGTWFRAGLKDRLCDLLLDPGARVAEFLEPAAIRRYLERHFEGSAELAAQLWCLMCLEIWLREMPRLLAPYED